SGLGVKQDFHPDLVVAHPERSLEEGVFAGGLGWSVNGAWYRAYMQALADALGFSMNTPWKQLPEKARNIILYGDPQLKLKVRYEENGEVYTFTRTFEGIIPNFRRRYLETSSDRIRSAMEKYMTQTKCPACEGARLKKEALSVRLADKNIYEFTQFNLEKAHKFLLDLKLSETESKIAEGALREILSRLKFLIDVGVGYLTLDRTAGTLSGGEAQRIRLATQIGSALMGVLYVLDEPSIGLHQSDNDRLIRTLKDLRNLGNTILVVEHDEETMQAADYIIDLGPGAGVHGGEVVFAGTYNQILKSKKSLTGKFLSGKEKINVPATRRSGNGKSIVVYGAEENNLKKIQVEFPLGKFICVTGLSGSGKSTLVNEILYKALRKELHGSQDLPGKHEKIEGIEHIDKVIDIDQSPIGRTPRSNPATYTGAFTPIRELFAKLPASKMRGYKPGRFSFNVPGGRCEACDGDGVKTIEMHFLADIYVTCEVCKGRRYNHETLEVRYNGKNIHDVLEMTVEEALTFFENIPAIKRKLQALNDVGLSYIKLGQPATTLSGGEAQRVKLATELSKTATGRTLYILDEPTTGLHFYDIRQLLKVLNRLVDAGNTVIVIEHNMDVIKTADYIIDLGPGGGDNGGRVVAMGTPEEVCNVKNSQTGKYLKKWLFSD
ncbi:MAG: excinuclease ABC subunit A, partial [Candidatus Hydrogenedentota bacterium]